MFDSLFDLPLVIVGTAIVVLLCAFALSGLAIFSRHILPRLKLGPEESVFTSAMMQAVMVFYGLAVALIAVSVWQTHTDAAATITGEASALASSTGMRAVTPSRCAPSYGKTCVNTWIT
jgi:hypothetical protein